MNLPIRSSLFERIKKKSVCIIFIKLKLSVVVLYICKTLVSGRIYLFPISDRIVKRKTVGLMDL